MFRAMTSGVSSSRNIHNLTHEIPAVHVMAVMDVDESRLQEVATQCR
ncbi:hypothetical protein KFU94_39235 [Chloroflexi bacterium TSY]|nr:hypothetical protein [Chloroflexi bacterium TSY]